MQWVGSCLLFTLLFPVVPLLLANLHAHLEIFEFQYKLQQYDNPVFFFVANMYNNEAILPNWTEEFIRVATIIGTSNVFLSVFENDSKDSTSSLLHDFKHKLDQLDIKNNIVTVNEQMRKGYHERITYLSMIRNHALVPLFDFLHPSQPDVNTSLPSTAAPTSPDPTSSSIPLSPFQIPSESDNLFLHTFTTNKHSKLVFLNDIYFKGVDIVRLISTDDLNYDIVCGLDFYTRFYDHYATRDLNGDWFADHFPFVRHASSQRLARREQSFPVYSCWNGGVSMNPTPFIENRLQFRADTTDPSCIHSECFLICEDFRRLGYPKVLLNPNVKVTYKRSDYLFHQYLTPISNFFLALLYHPQPTYVAPNAESVFNLTVLCGIPKT